MVNKKEFIVWDLNSVEANISINITDGELSYAAHWSECEDEDVTHDLKKHPDWKHAEELMKIVSEYHTEDFFKIAKDLKKNSRGYEIIRKIIRKQVNDLKSQISKITQEKNSLEKFL